MQVNLNTHQQNQNFGMSMRFTKEAKNLLKKPLLKDDEITRMQKLQDSQASNPVSIDIDCCNIRTLTAEIRNDKNHIYECLADTYYNMAFGSPIKFLEKCCKKADKYLSKLNK